MTRFAPGTFTPDARPATVPAMLAAQTRMELSLLLRNSEQLLLTMFIPVTMLVGLSLLPIDALGDHPVDRVAPAIMALAVVSTAFTGQAIAVGFDRRYGALKRLGATPLPRWGIIAGKTLAVAVVVVLQALLLGGISAALGWRPSPLGLGLGAVVLAAGVAAFATLGLLLGGTFKAEIVLALANLLWFVLLALGGLVAAGDGVPRALWWIARLSPSGALVEALRAAVDVRIDLLGLAILAAWAVVAGGAAVRWFRFT